MAEAIFDFLSAAAGGTHDRRRVLSRHVLLQTISLRADISGRPTASSTYV